MCSINIVPVTPQNALRFKAVRLRALQDAPLAFGSTYAAESQLSDADWVKRAVEHDGNSSIRFLAMDGGQPCGMIGSVLDHRRATQAHLVSMWTAPTHRRLGVGGLLVSEVIHWARLRNAISLRLTVVCSNAPAIRFYQQLGFAMTGRTEPYPNDPALFEYEMVYSITEEMP